MDRTCELSECYSPNAIRTFGVDWFDIRSTIGVNLVSDFLVGELYKPDFLLVGGTSWSRLSDLSIVALLVLCAMVMSNQLVAASLHSLEVPLNASTVP